MNFSAINAYAKIPQIPKDQMGFIKDLASPITDYFQSDMGCDPGENVNSMQKGVDIRKAFNSSWQVNTAISSLQRLFKDKGITENNDGYPVVLEEIKGLEPEEYIVSSTSNEARLQFSDSEGLRRSVYFYEDRLRECATLAATPGNWRRKPVIKHRISRCFFGPTYREPFFIDELMNDIDYYPDEYLNKLAHEGINGLWLSMYFHDLPSTIFSGRGHNAAKRLDKLQKTVDKCARYGIKIYLFFSEPKIWGDSSSCIKLNEAQGIPGVIGNKIARNSYAFCTSSELGKRYLTESITQIFKAVPNLGGVINIVFGEDNGSCAQFELDNPGSCSCPLCKKIGIQKVLQNNAKIITEAMKKEAPNAEYIAWFYAPRQRDNTDRSQRLASVANNWPADSGLMFNFESGGKIEQLGKSRTVFDYSLAYVGPSELFKSVANKVPKMAAKLQVGCSHEDASVPFIPVPLNLYDKYRTLHDYQVYAVMQCWYFGNYPGLMNKAAGELSFAPFPENSESFLLQLARPYWKKYAPQVAEAWKLFSQSYRQFPGNIAFEWYGPLHNSIAWPWHLFPVDQPLSPTWLLEHFPEVSGDRVAECLGYHHTMLEALQIMESMCSDWQRGLALLLPLRQNFAYDSNRLADIALAEAIGIQMQSTRNMLKFYTSREDMFYFKHNHLCEMADVVTQEIALTQRMYELCEQDSRLGYHSEAEGYLFFPAKLAARKQLLEKLLTEDFPKFDLNSELLDQFTGKTLTGKVAYVGTSRDTATNYPCGNSQITWQAYSDTQYLYFNIQHHTGQKVLFELEPCRCQPVLYFFITKKGQLAWDNFYQPREEQPYFHTKDDTITIGIPLEILARYRKEGFPMRLNISADGDGWVKREPWPYRLYQQDTNPTCLGWLIEK